MTIKEFHDLLSTTELPVAYERFKEKGCPNMPFICYHQIGTNNYAADGKVHEVVKRMEVQLFTKKKDINAEGKVEQALSSLFWQMDSEWNEDELCYRIIYTVEI